MGKLTLHNSTKLLGYNYYLVLTLKRRPHFYFYQHYFIYNEV